MDGFRHHSGNNMLEKISPESNKYEGFKEDMKFYVENLSGDESWGSYVLTMLRMNEAEIERLKEQPRSDDPESTEAKRIEELKQRSQEMLHKSFEHYLALEKNPRTKGSTIFLMSEAMQEPSIREELIALMPKGRLPMSKTIIKTLLERAEHGQEFSMELWGRILKRNQETYFEKLKVFQEKVLPEIKQKFLEAAHSAIERGALTIPEEKIRQAIDQTAFVLKDPTEAILENNRGNYKPNDNTISIASHLMDSYIHAPKWAEDAKNAERMSGAFAGFNMEELAEKYRRMAEQGRAELFHTFCHEVLHMLSGKTVVMKYEEGAEHLAEFDHKKIGLSHVGKKVKRFWWLNEALTDHLTLELTGEERKYAAYKKELELLELLRTKGKKEIPLQIFLNTYFESFDPNQAEEERLKQWRQLRLEIAEAYKPDFIIELDRIIQEKGIDEAIKSLKGD